MSLYTYQKPLDLSYLYEISDHDRDFIKDMIDTIVRTTPACIDEINAAMREERWNEIGRLVHKVKPSLLLLNIDSLSALIRTLEDNAKKAINTDQIPEQVGHLTTFTGELIAELKDLMDSDSF